MRKATLAALLLMGLVAWQTPRADAAVKLHGMFTDGMVLQQGMDVPIWGTADPGETVNVEIMTQREGVKKPDIGGGSIKADAKGNWQLVFPKKLKAGDQPTIVVTGGNNKVVVKDILVGEVWVASGQSNMEWAMNQIGAKDDIANSANKNIRLFDVPKTPSATPQTELGDPSKTKGPKGRVFAKWLECGPDSTANYSAVGYYFARKLQKDLNVPVGIINNSWGGMPAETYTSKGTLESLKIKGDSQKYNGMVVPVQPYAIRGVIWYQGESNAGRAKEYFQLMNALIKNWRDDWKQPDMPFLTVQLAPFEPGNNYADVREAQLYTMLKGKNIGMAVITDAGDRKNIHPPKKEPVGERLALCALGIAYDKKVAYNGPIFEKAAFDKEKASVSFAHASGGLVAKGGPLTGFTIAGKDGKFHKAEATIVENMVVVRSAEVPEPTAVRYGWANYPEVNLYNGAGLPASPFRSDVPEYYK
jgi:sialate O-acetylesterase